MDKTEASPALLLNMIYFFFCFFFCIRVYTSCIRMDAGCILIIINILLYLINRVSLRTSPQTGVAIRAPYCTEYVIGT